MCLRDVDMQKVVFCCTCPMIEILEMQPPTSFEMKKIITTITAKFAYRRGAKDEERGGVAKNKKAEYKNDGRDSF